MSKTKDRAAEVGPRLRSVRTALSLSQTEVAEQLGVTEPAMANWEAGRRKVELGTLWALCSVYSKWSDCGEETLFAYVTGIRSDLRIRRSSPIMNRMAR